MFWQEHAVDAVPFEIGEQLAQPTRHALQIDVMTEARPGRQAGLPRLSGVDLPRVEIEHAGRAILRVDAIQHPARHRIRQQAEPAATGRGPVAPHQRHRGGWQFENAGLTIGAVRETRRVGHAVMVMAYRIDARAVYVSCDFKFLDRPPVHPVDGETRRSITADGDAAEGFENKHGARPGMAACPSLRAGYAGRMPTPGNNPRHRSTSRF